MAFDFVDCSTVFAVFSPLPELKIDVTARQISMSFPLIGNGHFMWSLVIRLFLLVVLLCLFLL
jgi:hypothetical protein